MGVGRGGLKMGGGGGRGRLIVFCKGFFVKRLSLS
jgi:hypothetical protein